jgi:hypothetical protein
MFDNYDKNRLHTDSPASKHFAAFILEGRAVFKRVQFMSGVENSELRAGGNRISSLKRAMACDLHTSACAKRETVFNT